MKATSSRIENKETIQAPITSIKAIPTEPLEFLKIPLNRDYWSYQLRDHQMRRKTTVRFDYTMPLKSIARTTSYEAPKTKSSRSSMCKCASCDPEAAPTPIGRTRIATADRNSFR